jgi:hypothetical protein
LEEEKKKVSQRKTERTRPESTSIESQIISEKPSIQSVQKSFILGRKKMTRKVEPVEQFGRNLTKSIVNEKWISDTRSNFINQTSDNKMKALEQENTALKQQMKELENLIKQFKNIESNEPVNYKKLNDDEAKSIA